MKLIFIYGPPGAGKFTVGSELAKQTGYKFFHNHLTVPAAEAIFPEFGRSRNVPLQKMRAIMLEAAAKAGIDTIFTFAYSGKVDEKWVAMIVHRVEKYGGSVHFVQLFAPKEELERRITNKSRNDMGKISNKKTLNYFLETRDHYAKVKYSNNLLIDTSKTKPRQTVEKITRNLKNDKDNN